MALVFAGATSHAISLPGISPASHSHPHLLGDGLTTYRYDSEGRMESASTGQGEGATGSGLAFCLNRATLPTGIWLAAIENS